MSFLPCTVRVAIAFLAVTVLLLTGLWFGREGSIRAPWLEISDLSTLRQHRDKTAEINGGGGKAVNVGAIASVSSATVATPNAVGKGASVGVDAFVSASAVLSSDTLPMDNGEENAVATEDTVSTANAEEDAVVCKGVSPEATSPGTAFQLWLNETKASIATLKKDACSKLQFVVVDNAWQCNPAWHGLGNCLWGVLAGIVIAVVSGAVPIIELHGNRVQRSWLQEFHYDDILRTCWERRKTGKAVGMQFGAPDVGPTLMSANLSEGRGLLAPWTTTRSMQYLAGFLYMNPNLTTNICKYYPSVFNGPLSAFGFFHSTFHGLLRVNPDTSMAVDRIVKSEQWHTDGPFIVLHIRFGWALDGVLKCLPLILEEQKLTSARVYVASTWKGVEDAFKKNFSIDSSNLASGSIAKDGRKIQFIFSQAISEKGSDSSKMKDRKSSYALTDMMVLSRAEILVGHPRSTFLLTAAAVGLPRVLYLTRKDASITCTAQAFREPCMHEAAPDYLNKEPYRQRLLQRPQRIRDYYKYCTQCDEGA